MNAELKRADTEDWTQWERQIVNGAFALRRLLGCSAHGAVFLTEHKSKGLADAAIKLVRADGSQAQALQAQWQAAAVLSHPHLVRLFDVGRCRLAAHEFVFVVMEHADQTLAGILGHRPLVAEEAQELLLPTIEALTYLHRRNLAHGQLQPSNLLAVGDQLKLASDTVRPVGTGISTADDMLSLGLTLAEALTQRRPALSGPGSVPDLPDTLPGALVYTVRRCLNKNPAERPTVLELRKQHKLPPPADSIKEPPPRAECAREANPALSGTVQAARQSIQKPAAPAPAARESVPVPQPAAPEAERELTPPQRFGEFSLTLPDRPAAIAGVFAGALLIVLAVWIGSRATSTPQADLKSLDVPAPAAATPAVATPAVAAKPTALEPSSEIAVPPTPSDLPPDVVHRVLPDVSQTALSKIKGRIFVMVRVLVDPEGNVIGALMEDPGRSKQFARAAENAAREWRFVPSDQQRPRVWILRFAFTRDGITTRVIEQ